MVVLEHDEDAHIPIKLASDEEIVIDASGARAASRFELYAIEVPDSGRA